MKLLTDLMSSRKAQAFLVAVVVVLFGKSVNLTDLQTSEIVQVAMAYILGRAIHDHALKK
jgi:hypothetical protein